ncbi:hypothetical protein SJZ78_02955 [Acinetobacter baumannii]|nr:hypothetical protein [Acinetobacter baumannii]MDX7905378.1 hypothetical protein [Acinetobacter baumannii]MDX7925123.1 hypothetical protein [Acinetobacter baumannii]
MDKPMTFNEWLGTQGNMVLLHANCCRIAYEAGQQSQQAKVEELQKRVDAFKDQAVMLREAAKSWVYTEREQNILLSQADDIEKILGLEQALKGEG